MRRQGRRPTAAGVQKRIDAGIPANLAHLPLHVIAREMNKTEYQLKRLLWG